MTDSELLELAAKAAGIDAAIDMYGLDEVGNLRIDANDPPTVWNPLTDDGDALRLAVNLKLAVRPLDKCVFVESDPETLLGQSSVSELEMYANYSDFYTATRRAIVRAAAEIGKELT